VPGPVLGTAPEGVPGAAPGALPVREGAR